MEIATMSDETQAVVASESGFFTSDGTTVREPTNEELLATAVQLIEEKTTKAKAEQAVAKDEAAKAKSERILRGLAAMKAEDLLATPEGRGLMVTKWKRGVEAQIAEAKAAQAAAMAFLFEDDEEPAEPAPVAPPPAVETPKGKVGGNGHSKAGTAMLADEGGQTARVVAPPPERGPIEVGHPLRTELAGIFPDLVWRNAKWSAGMRFVILTEMHMRKLQGMLRKDQPNLTGEAVGLYRERVRTLQNLLDKLERVFRAHGVMTKEQIREISADDPQKMNIAREARKLPELAMLFSMPRPRSREEIEAERAELLALAEADEAKRTRRMAKKRLVDEIGERLVRMGGVPTVKSANKSARRIVDALPEDADLGNLDVTRLLKEAAAERQAKHHQENPADDRVEPVAEAFRKAAGGMSSTELDRMVRRKLGLPEPKREPKAVPVASADLVAEPTSVVEDEAVAKADQGMAVAPEPATEVVLATEPTAEADAAETMPSVPDEVAEAAADQVEVPTASDQVPAPEAPAKEDHPKKGGGKNKKK